MNGKIIYNYAYLLYRQIKEKDNQIELLSKYKEENELLKKENNSLRLAINQGETKEEYLLKPAEEFYDVIIDIKSINSLKNEGWKILRNEQRKEAYEKIIGEETMKIGVLGLNNVGKSFILGLKITFLSYFWLSPSHNMKLITINSGSNIP